MPETKLIVNKVENERTKSWDSLRWVSVLIMILGIVMSQPIHEVGHAIALNLLGISTTFGFAIRAAGPVLITRGAYQPSTIPELVFVIAAGPGFAAIVFAILGRFWRIEFYIAAIMQACYVPFELLNWMLGINSGHSVLALWLGIVVVLVPFTIGVVKIVNRIMWPKNIE